MDETTWIIIAAVAAVVVIALVVGISVARRRKRNRRRALQSRFGPEYDRTVETAGKRTDAERELAARAERRDAIELRPLDAEQQMQFRRRWLAVQSSFVEQPLLATLDAEALCTELLRTRGYPTSDPDEQGDLLSVDHPGLVQEFRAARDTVGRARRGEAQTEECRQAILRYRRCMDAMLDSGSVAPTPEPTTTASTSTGPASMPTDAGRTT